MKESIGYTVTLNIMIVFITIVVAFLCAALIYFKSNKVSNIITTAIEKYEGYNTLAISEINMNLDSVGYNKKQITCEDEVTDLAADNTCRLQDPNYLGGNETPGQNGYCVYECEINNGEYHFYKIRTNMTVGKWTRWNRSKARLKPVKASGWCCRP